MDGAPWKASVFLSLCYVRTANISAKSMRIDSTHTIILDTSAGISEPLVHNGAYQVINSNQASRARLVGVHVEFDCKQALHDYYHSEALLARAHEPPINLRRTRLVSGAALKTMARAMTISVKTTRHIVCHCRCTACKGLAKLYQRTADLDRVASHCRYRCIKTCRSSRAGKKIGQVCPNAIQCRHSASCSRLQ